MTEKFYICKDRGIFWKVDKDSICYYYKGEKWVEAMPDCPTFYSEIFMYSLSKNEMIRITKQEFENSLMLEELKK